MIPIKKTEISKATLDILEEFVAQVNADILTKYNESVPPLSRANLDFCLWKSLCMANKDTANFHKIWATSTLTRIAQVHPFGEGNKRTSYVVAKVILRLGNFNFEVDYDDAEHYLRKIASRKVQYKEVYEWVCRHAIPTKENPSPEIQGFISLLEKVINSD